MDGKARSVVKVLINAVSAKLGGAATYVRNLAGSLLEQAGPGESFFFVVPEARRRELPPENARIQVRGSDVAAGSYASRWWWEQVTLRRLVEKERPDVLFSSANFAMLACPVPQILLVRIPIYFDANYLAHILPEKGAAFRAETALRRWLVRQSVRAADRLMTPTAAMRDDLARFISVNAGRTIVNPYGVPRARLRAHRPPEETQRPLRVLWVSHYADHKNLGTLLRAVQLLKREVPFELWLTLDVENRGQHTPLLPRERELLAELGDVVRMLGVLPYEATWALHEQADLFVFPSLCESFGHPLVEAMAMRLPIVASDIAVHREICGPAAEYFPVLDASALAETLRRLLRDAAARQALAEQGAERVHMFLWEDHVARLLELFRSMARSRQPRAA